MKKVSFDTGNKEIQTEESDGLKKKRKSIDDDSVKQSSENKPKHAPTINSPILGDQHPSVSTGTPKTNTTSSHAPTLITSTQNQVVPIKHPTTGLTPKPSLTDESHIVADHDHATEPPPSYDLHKNLSKLLPLGIEWAQDCAAQIFATGTPLNEVEIKLAKAVGVKHPEKIRLQKVDKIPVPTNPALHEAYMALLSNINGITFGYAIYVVEKDVTNRLISHECRHVHQYEEAGSIADYLPLYLQQVAKYGYKEAPFEVDARKHEITDIKEPT